MKQKKKIDDIYREGLRHAETPPPPDSWEIINSRLDQRRRKNMLPLWIKWGSVAAVFALLVTVVNFTIFDTPLPEPVVQEEENFDHINSPAKEVTPEAHTRITNTLIEEEAHFSGSSPAEKTTEDTASAGLESKSKRNSAVAPNPSEKVRAATTMIAENTSEEEASKENKLNTTPEASTSPEALAETSEASEKLKNSEVSEANIKNNQFGKEHLMEETIAEANPADAPAKNDKFLNRLSISTNAGAVLFDIGNSNTVDEQFAGNPGGSEVSMTYGVNVAYKLSDKVKIRSGVNKMNFNYSTRQVDYAAAMSSSAVNAEPVMRATSLVIAAQGDVDQKFGFIEVPMEVEIALIDKKFGLNLIGGASTLFLEENRISMTTTAYTTDLGKSKNLNQLSFSANLGLGVNYQVAPKLRLNLEPLFKYQLKTFNHSNSYTFGIYSGLSYQF